MEDVDLIRFVEYLTTFDQLSAVFMRKGSQLDISRLKRNLSVHPKSLLEVFERSNKVMLRLREATAGSRNSKRRPHKIVLQKQIYCTN